MKIYSTKFRPLEDIGTGPLHSKKTLTSNRNLQYCISLFPLNNTWRRSAWTPTSLHWSPVFAAKDRPPASRLLASLLIVKDDIIVGQKGGRRRVREPPCSSATAAWYKTPLAYVAAAGSVHKANLLRPGPQAAVYSALTASTHVTPIIVLAVTVENMPIKRQGI